MPTAASPDLHALLDRKVLPILFSAYVINFLDRVNIAFVAEPMTKAIGLGPVTFGLGAGLFFVGYFLLEVPSNLVLARVGARRWLARIMVSWGIVAACGVVITTPGAFYAWRLALGTAEAGFVPALLVHVVNWYPPAWRAQAIAKVWSATAVALALGAPLSAGLLRLDGVLGLAGWRWLLLLEGLPAVILGVVIHRRLVDVPATADWLMPADREWLAGQASGGLADHAWATASLDTFRTAPVWLFSAIYLLLGIGFFGTTFWLPQMVATISRPGSLLATTLTTMVFIGAAAAMILVATWSDRVGSRRPFVLGGMTLAATGFGVCAIGHAAPVTSLAGLVAGACGLWSVVGIFWQLPVTAVGSSGRHAGLAIVNAFGSLGGFCGPYLIGLLREGSQNFGSAFALMSLAMLLATALLFVRVGASHNPSGKD